MTNARFLRNLAGLVAVAIVTTLNVWAQFAVPQRVTRKIDETRLTTITGHVRPFLKTGVDRGPVDSGERIGVIMLMLSRTPEQQQDLDALVDELHNVRSPNYHKWLTPEQFGERFEPADEDVAVVKGWLESKGLTVLDVVPSKTHIAFTGTVGQLQDAFHVLIHHVSVNGEEHEATINEPQVPAALASVIGGLHKLDDFSPRPLFSRVGAFTKNLKTGVSTPVTGTVVAPKVPAFTNGDSADSYYELAPQDFYTVYNESPLLSAGITGAGQTIAVIEEAQVEAADVDTFRAQFGLAAYPHTPNPEQGGVNYLYGSGRGLNGYSSCLAPASQSAGKISGEESEADIDLQWAGAVAPNATVDLVACGGASESDGAAIGSLGIDHSAQYIVNFLADTVVAASMSYGECESDMSSAATIGVGYYNTQWEQFAAEGITAVVSAGNSDSERCYQNSTTATSQEQPTNGLGSSAYNVSAGGTEFGDAYVSNNYTINPASTWWGATGRTEHPKANSYIPETAWAGYCSNALVASYLQKAGSNASTDASCNRSNAGSSGGSLSAMSGGTSTFTNIPTWQSVYGVGVKANSTPLRNLPDVSMFASGGLWGHFLPYCESDLYPCTHSEAASASNLGGGGTSFVAPQLVGLMALISQKSNSRQGQANYKIYDLAAHEFGTPARPNVSELRACSGSVQGANVDSSCIFHDISDDLPSLQGRASAVGSAKVGSTATPGYDNFTGLGSLNISNLVERWSVSNPGFASKTALKSSVEKIASTGSVTLTATVTASGRGGIAPPAGKAQFFLDSTSGALLGSGSIVSNCAGSGSSASCNGVAILTVPGKALNPGSNNVIAYFEGDGANDESSTSERVHVEDSTGQTISFTTPSTVVYGASPITLSATASSGLPVTFSLISGPGTLVGSTLNFTGAGSVVIEADQPGNDTYSAAPPVQQTISVTPAPLTITVASVSETYGNALPTFTSTLTGLMNGDASSDVVATGLGSTRRSRLRPALQGTVDGGAADLTVIYSTTASATSPYSSVGTYPITATLSGSAAGNYAVTIVPGTLTINPASVSITVASFSETYGNTLPTFTSTLTGLVNGDASADFVASGHANARRFALRPALKGTVDGGAADLTVTYSTTANASSPYSKVGAYPITAALSGSAAANYTIVSNTPGSLTITPAALTVTVTSASESYGSSLPTLKGSVTGAVNGDTVGTTLTVSYSTTASSSAPYSPVGSYPISATLGGSSLGNYTVTNTPGTLTIGKASLSITVASFSETYGNALPTFTSTLTGLVNGDASAEFVASGHANARRFAFRPALKGTVDGGAADLTVTYSTTANASSPYSGVGAYPITATLSGSAAGNYSIVSNTPGTLTITTAALTVTVTSASESYGSPLPTLKGSVTGAVNGDTVGTTLTVSYSTTANSSSPYSNAGVYPITASLGGSSLGNYTVTNTSGALTIAAIPLTITVASVSETYGNALPTFTSTLTGLVNGDASSDLVKSGRSSTRRSGIRPAVGGSVDGGAANLTVTYSTTANATSPYSGVGTYPITATLSGSAAGNYTITKNTPGTLTITTAALTITVTSASESYGSPLPTLKGNVTGAVNGDTVGTTLTVSYSTTARSSAPYSPVGPYPISATVGGSSLGNYKVTNTPGTLTIGKAALTITVANASGTYGSALPVLKGSVTGTVNGDTVGTTLTVSYSTTARSSAPYSPAGPYPITATVGGSSLGNYIVTNTPGTLTIDKAALTITVANASETYGNALPTFTSTLTGLVNGDANSSALVSARGSGRGSALRPALSGTVDGSGDLTVDYSTTASATSPYSGVGTYPITATLSGPAAGNYTITSNTPGTLTIGKVALKITVDNASGTYGSALPTLKGSVTGEVNGDTVGTTLTVSYSTTAKSSAPYSNVGTYAITASLGGTAAHDYSVTVAPGSLTITQASLSVKANNATRAFGQANPSFTAAITGFVNGDSQSVVSGLPSLTTAAISSSPVGNYTIIPSQGTLKASNYTFKFVDGTLTITQATPEIAWTTPAAITYGTVLSSTQLDATSNVKGVFTYTPAAMTVLTAGTHTLSVTLTPTDKTDYTTATSTVTLTVSPALLSVKANNATRMFGHANPSFTAAITGFVNGDKQSVVSGSPAFTTAAISSSPLGNYPIIPSQGTLKASNYTFKFVDGTLTITKATPAIAWATPEAITYGTKLSSAQLDATSKVAGTFKYTPAAGTLLPVGKDTLSVTFTPTNTTDYTTATATVTLTVNKVIPAIVWATPAAITYGTALSSTQLDATSKVAGKFTYTPAAGTVLPVGTHTLSATFTPTDTAHYATATATVTLTVKPAPSFTVAALPTSLTVTRGASGKSTITVNDKNGFTGKVTLAASGLPSGVTAAFATNPTTGTSVLTLTASSSAATGTASVKVVGTSGSLSASTTITLTVSK